MLKAWFRRNPGHEEIFVFRTDRLLKLAKRHSGTYLTNSPYPHAVIENFLPARAADRLVEVFPKPNDPLWLDWRKRDTIHQPRKQGIGHAERLAGADPFLQQMLSAFNSYPVVHFLEALTGIDGLIPDPHLTGGGLQQILPQGKLAIHADFNYLEKLKLYRRVNLLLFLNQDWKEAYGGHLELWDKSMSQCVKKILPVFNRCVVFNTGRTSFHGHPHPLNCPADFTRKALALYYYTRDGIDGDIPPHETLWQSIPGEG